MFFQSYDHKSLDFWSLNKSILNTLLQAVKAIKGGVIAVKGQLIKGSGYLTAATGKLIVAKGDAVTNLGKKIASSAVLVPYHGHPSSHAGKSNIRIFIKFIFSFVLQSIKSCYYIKRN